MNNINLTLVVVGTNCSFAPKVVNFPAAAGRFWGGPELKSAVALLKVVLLIDWIAPWTEGKRVLEWKNDAKHLRVSSRT